MDQTTDPRPNQNLPVYNQSLTPNLLYKTFTQLGLVRIHFSRARDPWTTAIWSTIRGSTDSAVSVDSSR